MGKYELTQAQWCALMGTNRAQAPGVGDDYPVHNVTWNDCQEFISRLNALAQGRFRLPTEAEWEYVCRAGTKTRFWFGDALDCSDVREYGELLDTHFWWGGNNGQHGYPVGCKTAGLNFTAKVDPQFGHGNASHPQNVYIIGGTPAEEMPIAATKATAVGRSAGG
jgi:formylglycine-generating enzyme required for sulfatase activity